MYIVCFSTFFSLIINVQHRCKKSRLHEDRHVVYTINLHTYTHKHKKSELSLSHTQTPIFSLKTKWNNSLQEREKDPASARIYTQETLNVCRRWCVYKPEELWTPLWGASWRALPAGYLEQLNRRNSTDKIAGACGSHAGKLLAPTCPFACTREITLLNRVPYRPLPFPCCHELWTHRKVYAYDYAGQISVPDADAMFFLLYFHI